MAEITGTVYEDPYGDPELGQYIELIELGHGFAPGEISLRITASAFTLDELDFADRESQFTGRKVKVEVNKGRNFGKVSNIIKNEINNIANQAGFTAQMILGQIRGGGGGMIGGGGSLSPDFNLGSVTTILDVPVGGEDTWEKTWSFTPIKVPVPEGFSLVDRLNDADLPELEITTTAQPNTLFNQSQETIRIPIEPEAFIEEVSLDASCGEIFSEIKQRLDKLPNRIDGKISGAESARSRLENIANQLATEANISTSASASQFASNIRDISQQDLTSVDVGRADILSTNTRLGDAEDLRSEVEDLRTEIRNNVPSRCADEFMNELDVIDDALHQLENVASEAQELKDAILDILPEGGIDCATAFSDIQSDIEDLRADIGVDQTASLANLSFDRSDIQDFRNRANEIESRIDSEVPDDNRCSSELRSKIDDTQSVIQQLQSGALADLGCADLPSKVRDLASSVQGMVGTFVSKDQLARVPNRKEQLIGEVDEAINTVEQEASDQNPCKRQILSRLRETRSSLQAAPVRPETAIPCEQRYEDIGSELEQFENEILNLSPPVRPQKIQEVAQRGNDLADMIEQNISADDPCRQEMPQRVSNLVNRAESMVTQIRIETEGETGEEQRREELINQLLGSIDRLDDVGSGDNVDDIVDETQNNIPTT